MMPGNEFTEMVLATAREDSEFCVALGTVTRTTGIVIHSWL